MSQAMTFTITNDGMGIVFAIVAMIATAIMIMYAIKRNT